MRPCGFTSVIVASNGRLSARSTSRSKSSRSLIFTESRSASELLRSVIEMCSQERVSSLSPGERSGSFGAERTPCFWMKASKMRCSSKSE